MKLFGTSNRAKYANPRKSRLWLLPLLLLLPMLALFAVYRAEVKPAPRKDPLPAPPTAQQPVPEPGTSDVQVIVPNVTPLKPPAELPHEKPVETLQPRSYRDGVYNVLLCGTDDDGLRTDTILIAHLDANDHSTALMSVPRDTLIESGGGLRKLNSIYNGGGEAGMERLCATLHTLLGFPVDAYVLVDFDAFRQTVDLIGGVWFDVPQDMYYHDPAQELLIDLKAGYQCLNGEQSMGLVRYRKGYATQDIQRTRVQQDFLRAMAQQTLSIGNLGKLKELVQIILEHVQTDLSIGNILYFAQALMDCDLSETESHTIEGQGLTIQGGSYYPLFDWSILEIVNASFNPFDTPITASHIRVLTPSAAEYYYLSPPPAPEPEPEPELPPEDPLEPESTASDDLWG